MSRSGTPSVRLRDVLEEGDEPGIGPVQVLEHEDRRVALGEVLEEAAPGREQLLLGGGRGGLDAQERQEPLAEPGALDPLGKDRLELVGGDRRRDRTRGCPRAP